MMTGKFVGERGWWRWIVAPAVVCLGFVPGHLAGQNFSEMKPTPQQVEWADLEMGAIIHFGTNTFLDREWGDGTAPASTFDPKNVDAEQWVEAVKAAGIKYVVLVAKHHDGFTLWPSELTDYGVKNSPWRGGKGDLVREVSDAARKNGLKFGVYLSPWDRHDPRYADAKAYDKYYLGQLDELASNYGPLEEWWMDGAGSGGHTYDFDRIVEELRMWQPGTLVFADTQLYKYADLRWVGNESGHVEGENWNVVDRAGYLRWRPVESDTPLRKLHWFWHPNDEASVKGVDELMEDFTLTVGRGAQLMLGIAPDKNGRVPDSDVARLREFGDAVRAKFAHPVMSENAWTSAAGYRAVAGGEAGAAWTATTPFDGVMDVSFKKPVTFNYAVTMEWLVDGQHVQRYAIEVERGGKWGAVASGQAIGHKKIDEFAPVTAQNVRLRLISTTAAAHIRDFELYNTGDGTVQKSKP
jgi:alpha-L-fucosidase